MTAWRKTPPTEPGWYWCRRPGKEAFISEIAQTKRQLGGTWRLFVRGAVGDDVLVDEIVGYEWQGPLRPEE